VRRRSADVVVIGGGPAGLAAAYQARVSGAQRVLIIERNPELGGILMQCIHNGFGVTFFGEDLTGPEYASRWIRRAADAGVQAMADTMVLDVRADREGSGLWLTATGASEGLVEVDAEALVLAMGCRERPRGALAIPGTRPAGVYTAGTAQRLVNMEGYMPGRRFVILGSGDIGMIMARRLTLEGAEVVAMLEILPYVSGLRRNLVQCVRDFDIPLRLCTTITEIRGAERVESVVVSQVDERWAPLPGTEEELACDSVLLSVGLIPENELSRQVGVRLDPITGGPVVDETLSTSVPGVYAAGNVVHVYDLVDDVTESALRAGERAAAHALGTLSPGGDAVRTVAGRNVRHVVPQIVHPARVEREGCRLELRVREPIEGPTTVRVWAGQQELSSRRLRYARPSEMIALDLPSSSAHAMLGGHELTVDVVEASLG